MAKGGNAVTGSRGLGQGELECGGPPLSNGAAVWEGQHTYPEQSTEDVCVVGGNNPTSLSFHLSSSGIVSHGPNPHRNLRARKKEKGRKWRRG